MSLLGKLWPASRESGNGGSLRVSALLAATVTVVLALGTFAIWSAMARSNEQQIARIAEAESYAARSQLVRNLDTVLAALRNVRVYWYAFGHLPRKQWASNSGIDLDHIAGIEMILWDDPAHGVRYLRTGKQPTFDYRPDDDEWSDLHALLERARQSNSDALLGPFRAENGGYYLEVIVTGRHNGGGRLAALLNVDDMFDRFLADESPEFAVQIFSGDALIYERGEPDPSTPDSWIREGMIRSSFDTLWRVRHLPTTAMLESFAAPAMDLTLLLGLIVAVLMGTLTFENNRARSRAHAAEVAETRLSKLNRNLEYLVERRTRELAARSADLQTLADSVAHDLRNPLNSMSVNLELLEDSLADSNDEERMTVLGRLSPCIDQMTTVLDRLLGLSTVANATFERERIAMNEFVTDIFEDLATTEPAPPVVRFEVDELPQACADRTLTEVLLTNLLSNALKYTRGVHDRRIRVGADVRDGETIYFVSDNGIGFDAGQAEKIFSAFTRVHEDTKAEGIGLGLALVKKVIARHEGRIWAESKPGNGATFYFTLSPAPGEATHSSNE